mmetsp:Transcript_28655/g.43736  ORF Transcript_28655/g.43736 Transcript_28655/m.43736 type:complete len:1599 (+) Transcript_28655:220-5016(+)|eukprot:CAMPEP_0194220352 /NCGR_PEP_ID=MMETSP0156-20130528/28123_1 /TAXON_ID=33649 /ORGANISM="Thalassionema nitzschioides, Strain L26-B" /LENGTH=1598 /DNA_ID=CAMNT_0038950345 /DNA_START=126 /DNA_END=4922 /DNA_ORIENTATION=+
MEAYPEDLLTGVFPLVFAVNTILRNTSENEDMRDSVGINQDEKEGNDDDEMNIKKSSSTRSLFDRFLDAMASNLGGNEPLDQRPSRGRGPDFVSLLRGSSEHGTGSFEDSSDEEDVSMSMESNSSRRIGLRSPSLARMRPSSPMSPQSPFAFANSLKLDAFFDRSRVVSISTKHGFPPSKDATGQNNRSLKLSQARSALRMNPTNANALRLKRVMDQHPIEGVMQSGWFEKHVHALPSVLLVVTSFQTSDTDRQLKQDELLLETIANLQEGLASKRKCSIRVVCLADIPDKPNTPAKLDGWIKQIRKECDVSYPFNILKIPHDLSIASPGLSNTSEPLQNLHKQVRDASWAYYLSLARYNKRKYSMLGYDHQPALLPLAVRYCFKVGVFYEFLLKHSKALKYISEAYRHLQNYYRHLVGKLSLEWNPVVSTTDIVNPQGDDDGIEATISESTFDQYQQQRANFEGGVEVALADDEDDDDDDDDEQDNIDSESRKKTSISTSIPLDVRKIFTEIDPPFDMGSQCRAVADWLNFKIVQAGLQSASISESDKGILAASIQWRQHCQVFLKHDDPNDPSWNYWSYVAQQRHAMSQLVERFPPRNLTSVGGLAKDEVLMRFSSWRNYAAAAEAKLRCGVEVRKAVADNVSPQPLPAESLRKRFVGGLDSEGLVPLLHEEATEKHIETALKMLKRAISRFEAELENPDQINESFHRSGARMYYLIGGILLGKKEHQEAIVHLERAVKYAQGWKGLELATRRMLIECYEKRLASQTSTTDEQNATIASMILDSFFNANMSSTNLRRALRSFSTLASDGLIKWHRECIDESNSSLPFSFAVTFPGTTHGTVGETATASVMIKSNLDYAVHVNSVTLLSMAGKVEVPSNSLLSAQNANEGKNGGIIMQGKSSILFNTQIEVPKDLANIASDEGGNGGEKEGIAGKGSFAKSARPRTAGLTSGAGARLVSENQFKKGLNAGNSQWSVRYLGGKPFRCDGLCLRFYPVQVEKTAVTDGSNKVNIIELTIEKKRQRTAANIKRTPFEEDNYIASAWSRPDHLDLSRGPRCLRILGPMPEMIVTNITDPLIDGKVVEGTVNRILIKLQAGPTEICEDIKYKVKCASMLLGADGSTKHLNALNTDLLNDNSNKIEVEQTRSPCLVCHDITNTDCVSTPFGYDLPRGWKLVDFGRRTEKDQVPSSSTLKKGEETYIYFDVYRPSRDILRGNTGDNAGMEDSSGGEAVEDQMCRTDFDVTITYKQSRPKTQRSRGRRRRKPPANVDVEQEKETSVSDDVDQVSLEFTGSVVWVSPLSAKFQHVDAAQKYPPSGSRHPSNSIQNEATGNPEDTRDQAVREIALIDGESVSTRCTLSSEDIPSSINIGVSRVWFEEHENSQCQFRVVGEDLSSSTFFESDGKDLCHLVGKGKKTGIVLNAMVNMKDEYKGSSLSTNMGVINVNWTPKGLEIPSAVSLDVHEHGPLSLADGSILKFFGPVCYVESAPFETNTTIKPSCPRVGSPFELLICIENKSNIHQTLSLEMIELDEKHQGDMVISGSTKTELRMSPSETQYISYTGIATKSGKLSLPPISIASTRYKTWILRGSSSSVIYVLP